MKRPIPSERYWELKAKEMEVRLLSERQRGLDLTIKSYRSIVEVCTGAQQILSGYKNDLAAVGQAISGELGELVKSIGEEVGLTGDPRTWQVDLAPGIGAATIEERSANG